MRLTRSVFRRTAWTVGMAALVAGGVAAALPAQAAESTPNAAPDSAAVTTLTQQLGDRSAGAYRDESTGATVVTVTDAAAARQVKAAGAVPRTVRYGATRLARVTDALAAQATIPGTAWAVDPRTDQVVVTVDASVTGTRLDQLTAVTTALGDTVRVEHTAGVFSTRAAGGDAIYGGQYRCSLGFNVKSGSTYYFLTAGHCGNVASTWYSNSGKTSVLGNTAASTFPGHDYAIVRYTNGTTPPGNVDQYGSTQDITSAAAAYVGESVRRSGSTSHVHSGTVQALNATVNYSEGTVTGLIRTNVCAEAGDSGGPLYSGTTALGLTSGGSGNCTSGGTTFFQPVTAALSAYGVSVY